MTPLFPSYRDFQRLEGKVDLALSLLHIIHKGELALAKNLDTLEAEVAQTETVMASALKLIDDLAVRIAEAGTDPGRLQKLTTELSARRQALAAAIAANTDAHDETNQPPAEVIAPSISSVSPMSGAAVGGETVTIAGSGFTDATAVEFGSTPASSFTVDSDTQITAVTPALPADGGYSVTVVGPNGTGQSPNQFTFA